MTHLAGEEHGVPLMRVHAQQQLVSGVPEGPRGSQGTQGTQGSQGALKSWEFLGKIWKNGEEAEEIPLEGGNNLEHHP